MQILQDTASSVLKTNMPISNELTVSVAEKSPQINMLFVSFAAWKIEPEVDIIIWMPTESASIWNGAIDFIHWLPNNINVISVEVKYRNMDNEMERFNWKYKKKVEIYGKYLTNQRYWRARKSTTRFWRYKL